MNDFLIEWLNENSLMSFRPRPVGGEILQQKSTEPETNEFSIRCSPLAGKAELLIGGTYKFLQSINPWTKG